MSFPRADDTPIESPSQFYAQRLIVQMRDVLAEVALPVNPNATALSVYEAEKEEIAQEIDARLIPLLVFVSLVPFIAVLTSESRCLPVLRYKFSAAAGRLQI